MKERGNLNMPGVGSYLVYRNWTPNIANCKILGHPILRETTIYLDLQP